MHNPLATLSLLIVYFVSYVRSQFQTKTFPKKDLFLLFLSVYMYCVDDGVLCGEFMIIRRFAKPPQMLHLK